MTQCKNIDESTKITKKNVFTFAKLFGVRIHLYSGWTRKPNA